MNIVFDVIFTTGAISLIFGVLLAIWAVVQGFRKGK